MTALGATCAPSAATLPVIVSRSTLACAWLSITRQWYGPRQSARKASGSPLTTSEAPIGASPASASSQSQPPPPAAASLAASPCRYAAAIAACGGSSPCASSAPASPASTSPVPAVASHGVPVVLTSTGSRPSGGATTVVDPLSSTQAPNSVAARRAYSMR